MGVTRCWMWRHCCDARHRRRRRTFSDHYSWPDVRDLLLQLQDFLGKRVDLRILFVDFFRQRFNLRAVSCFHGLRGRRLSKSDAKRRNQCHTKNSRELHRVEDLATGSFVWQATFAALYSSLCRYGRGAGVRRGLGVGVPLGVGLGLAVAVGVAIGVAVIVGVLVAVGVAVVVDVGVGVGVGVDAAAQYLPPVFK